MGFNPTELRIIRLMCLETDNADIAALLKISNGTLKRYRAAIMAKSPGDDTCGAGVLGGEERVGEEVTHSFHSWFLS
jgi:hypothetical protein